MFLGALVPEDQTLTTITNTRFESNYADYGGAVDDGTTAKWSCTNCVFYRNRGQYGGAYYAYADAQSTFRNTSFIENTVTNAGGASQTSTRSIVTFDDCLFEGNSASDTGAIGCANAGTTFRRCIFRNNYCPTVASAINARVNTTVDGCTFIGNQAGERGAIATTGDPSNIIKNSIFIDNYSAISASAILFESAVAFDLTLSNLTFINNQARSIGGSMYATGTGTISIDKVVADRGYAGNGGLFAMSGTGLNVRINNANVQGINGVNGGAFHIGLGATLQVNNSVVNGNNAIAGGGVFYVDGTSTVTLVNVSASGNSARYGGFVSFSALASTGCDVTMTGCTLTNNSATNGGGIFWSEDDFPACTTNTINTNIYTANGGAYGNIRASPPHTVRLDTVPPESVAPSQPFTALISVLDFYNQTVRENRNFVGEVTVVSSTNPAVIGGISREDITANGTISFTLLRINARPNTVLTLDFHTLPRLSFSRTVNISVTACAAGFEEYISAKGYYYCLRTVDTTSATQITLAVISAVLSFACIVLFFILLRNRESPIIRAASPLFCLAIVLGGLFTLVAAWMFLWNTDATCALRPWFYALGFMILYGSLFVKEFRMFRIFNANLTKPLKITNQQLFGMVGAGMVVEIAILIGWFASAPYIRIPRVDDLELTTIPAITYECSSRNPAAFWVLVGFNLLLLTVCSVIAFLTRNLPDTLCVYLWLLSPLANFVDSLRNESRGMAFAIYNCTLTMVVCLVVAGVLYSPTAVSLVGNIGILFSTTVTLGALFLPKLWLTLRKDAVIRSIREDISQLKSDIEWKERQINEIERGFRGESSASKDTSLTAGSTKGDTRAASAAPSAAMSAVASGNGDSSDETSSSDEKPKKAGAKKSAKKAGGAKKAAKKAESESDSESQDAPAKKSAKKADSDDSSSVEQPKKAAAKKATAKPKKVESESDSEQSSEEAPKKKAPAKKPAKPETSSDEDSS